MERSFPDADHAACGVNTADGDVGAEDELRALSFEVIRSAVLTCADMQVRDQLDTAHDLRPLTGDCDWSALECFQLKVEEAETGAAPDAAQRAFLRARGPVAGAT